LQLIISLNEPFKAFLGIRVKLCLDETALDEG